MRAWKQCGAAVALCAALGAANAQLLIGQTAGFTEFVDRETDSGTQRIFPHTEVDEAFGGRGLATILVREAL